MVSKLVKNIESALELSDALNLPLVQKLLPRDLKEKLQDRVEYELTPAEPDPETGDATSREARVRTVAKTQKIEFLSI